MTTKFPWTGLFQLALNNGITPEKTWNMTPAELTKILNDHNNTPNLRDEISKLMKHFPDHPNNKEKQNDTQK